MIKNRLLFNFAVSHSGGGLKRLYEYAKWFNKHGGAWFIIHPRCSSLIANFPNNQFFIVNQSKIARLYNDGAYLSDVCSKVGVPELYYSYGIPVYFKVGKINWFHLSNVLPLNPKLAPLSFLERLQMSVLGKRINNNFKYADVVSAESNFSLSLIHPTHGTKLFLSVNGSDDELSEAKVVSSIEKENIATVVGTYRYKAIEDSCRVFEMLQVKNRDLKLLVIGNAQKISKHLKKNKSIIFTGNLGRGDVIKYLKKSKYYISTTHIENSYNAASEGVFLANESYISDIGPHKELLEGMPFQRITVPNMNRSLLHVQRDELSMLNLKTWDNVINEMLLHALG